MRAPVAVLSLLLTVVAHGQAVAPPHPAGLRMHVEASDRDVSAALARIEGLRFLSLRGCKRLGSRSFTKLGKIKTLESLDCRDAKISDKWLARLTGLKKLKRFELRGCKRVGNGAMGTLRKLPSVEALDVVDTNITGPGIKKMAGLKYLRELRCGTPKWSPRDLEVLPWLPKLVTLEIHGAKAFGDGSALAVLAKLKMLEHLSLGGGGELGASWFTHVGKTLKTLELLGETRISPPALGELKTLVELRNLTLTGADTRMIEAIDPPNQITRLRVLASPQFDDATLAKVSEKFPNLTELDLRGAGGISSKGFTDLGTKLRKLTQLTLAMDNAAGIDLTSFKRKLRKLTIVGDAESVPVPDRHAGATVDFTDTHTFKHGGGCTNVRLLTVLPRSVPRRQRIHRIVCEPAPAKIMLDEQLYADFSVPGPKRVEVIKVTYRAEVYQYDLDHARKYRGVDVALGAAARKAYTSPSKHIDSKDPGVVELASKAKVRGKSALQLATQLHELVCRRMEQSSRPGSIGAANALKAGNGDCTEYADLFTALCRARGLPARVVTGALIDPKATKIRHSWVEVYFKQHGWVPFDPIFNDQEGAKASSVKILRFSEQYRRIDEHMTSTGKTLNFWWTTQAGEYSEALSYQAAPLSDD